MNRHGSINRIYRLIWNDALQAFVPAAETTRGRGKRSTRRLAATALALGVSVAHAGPIGGHVTAGAGTVTQSETTTTVDQSSQNLALTWQSFNVASNETVNFVQPSVSAIAVNRILSSDGSVILGHVNANGQVYLINPNGVLFGRGAEVNVGGLVASTLDIDDTAFSDTSKTFKGSGAGTVVNEGTLTASSGGSIALLANRVGNTGVITAKLGTVALGAGNAVTLTFSGSHMVGMQVDQSVLDSEAQNGGLIRTDGGSVVMTAGAERSLRASVVNNTGIIEAQTVDNHAGTIILRGGMTAGMVNVGGTLDAGAPLGSDAGFIETSASRVEIAPGSKVTTAAAHGLNGTWLIDPNDFTIAATGGDATGAQVSAALGNGNVDIESNAGAGGTSGNVKVNDVVSWSANTLTLTAQNNILINSTMNGSGTASLALVYGQGSPNASNASTYSIAAPVNLPAGPHFSTKLGSDGMVNAFTVVTSVGAEGDELTNPPVATLQSIAALGNLASNFVLGANIDASATSGWNACKSCFNGGAGNYGFTPIGSLVVPFSGTFDGLGHTITNLSMNQPGSLNIGMFGASSGIVQNVGLIGAAVTGGNMSGALAGTNMGTVSGAFSTGGSVIGGNTTGGLIGQNYGVVSGSFVAGGSVNGARDVGGLIGVSIQGSVAQSYSTASVTGTALYVGGLIGEAYGPVSISDSYATGNVTGASYTGGFIGANNGGTLQRDYATGSVTGSVFVGGLVGVNSGTVSDSYASGNVAASGSDAGGLVGVSSGAVASSYASGNVVSAGSSVGGLIGASSASVSTSHASGNVSGGNSVGGLIGNSSAPVSTSFSTGSVTGQYFVGGLVGVNSDSVTDSYAAGTVNAVGVAGGLVGLNYGTVSLGFASGDVSVSGNTAGGLIGQNAGGTVDNTYATGAVAGGSYVGGLVGFNGGPLTNSYASGSVTSSNSASVGGLVGWNGAAVANSFYSITANPSLTGSGGVADSPGAIWGMSTADLQTSANFTTATTVNGGINPAWDLAATWVVYEGHTTPLLQAFMTPLTIGNTPVTEVYDGGVPFALTSASLTYSSTPDPTHLFGTPSIGGTLTGAAHVGTYSSPVSGLYSDQLGYMITYSAGSLSITPAPVTVTGSTASKVYDGTTMVDLAGGTLSGVFSGDALTLTSSGTFASPHVGSNIAVTAMDSLSGANAGDYVLTQPTGLTGTITPAQLTVSGATSADKVYDGTTLATLTGGQLVGVVSGDTVNLTQAGTFASKNVGASIAVSASDSLSGASASDYILVEPTGLAATITPASLTVTGSRATGKVYDGTTVAALTGGSLVGVLTGDAVTLTQAGTFASKNAGTSIAVSADDSLSGAAAGNYSIAEPTGLTANITPATLTVSSTTAGNKVYDGTTAAALTGGSLVGVLTGDAVTLTQAGTFASKNVGASIAVSANDSLSGAASGNYTIVEPTGLTATITPASLTVNGTTVASRVYNGTDAAPVQGGSLVGVVSGDSVLLNQSGTFASANVGTNIAVTATDTLSGSSAGDYSVIEPTGLSGTIFPGTIVANAAVTAALHVRAQIEADLLSPSFGGNMQSITASTTIGAVPESATADNVTVKIGPIGTLTIEQGGLRLPGNLVQGN